MLIQDLNYLEEAKADVTGGGYYDKNYCYKQQDYKDYKNYCYKQQHDNKYDNKGYDKKYYDNNKYDNNKYDNNKYSYGYKCS